MKRFSMALVVSFFFAVSFSDLYAESSFVGVIVKGYEENCEVIHDNVKYNGSERRGLYVGDIIVKKPSIDELEVQLEPYVKLESLDSDNNDKVTKVRVVYKDDSNDVNILERTKNFIKGFLRPVKLTYFFAATRDFGDEAERNRCKYILQKELDKPSPYSTVFLATPVEFVWDYDFSAIVFEDLGGQEVFRKNVKDAYSAGLSPEEMDLKRDTMYNWYYEYEDVPLEKKYKMKLLDRQTERKVLDTLKEIDKQEIMSIEKTVQKSAYLQLFSDKDENVDLYWLSYQILPKNVDALNEEDTSLVCKLKFRYMKYLENLSL